MKRTFHCRPKNHYHYEMPLDSSNYVAPPIRATTSRQPPFLTFWRKHLKRIIGFTFMFLAFLVTIFIVFMNRGDKPASTRENISYVIISGICQIIGASFFNRHGKADPTLARTAVRDLKGLLERTRDARIAAENAYDLQNSAGALTVLGILSRDLSWIEEIISHAVNNWTEFHPDAVKKVEEIDQL